MTSDGITKPFDVITLADEGMPLHNFASQVRDVCCRLLRGGTRAGVHTLVSRPLSCPQHGNMLVKIIVDFPATLSDAQRKLVQSLFP